MKRRDLWRRLFWDWLSGWTDLLVGLVTVLTFTLWRPWWDFRFRGWTAKYEMRRRMGKKT